MGFSPFVYLSIGKKGAFIMRLLILLIITLELIGCGGVGSGREERRSRRDYDRRGEVPDGEVEEEISDTVRGVSELLKDINNYLKNCESDIPNIPRTEVDVFLTAVGWGNFNKLGQARECLEQRLQEVTKKICQSKEDIYTQAQKYRNYDQRYERIQSGIDRVEEMHENHQEWLLDQADRFYDKADRYDSSSSMRHDELRAYAEIFESESYISCPYDSYGSRRRNSRRGRY